MEDHLQNTSDTDLETIFTHLFFRHGPNQSPSPKHLSPQQTHSHSRSPLHLSRQTWPTSPSERVKLTTLVPSSPRADEGKSGKYPSRPSSSSAEESSDEESSVGERKPKTGDPYSTKNRKKYQKATEQRKRSPTLKERFQWQPPSEDETEAGMGIAATEGHDQVGKSPKNLAQSERSGKVQEATRVSKPSHK